MKNNFDVLSAECSKLTTKNYSTSFSLGILFLHKSIREAIYAIYGFVRFADEIVDSFNDFDKKYLLEKFKQDCYDAIEQRISLNPILNSFQKTIHLNNINMEYINQFFISMEMDLNYVNYNKEKYNKYILGSAEIVGLMCLQVFTAKQPNQFEHLKPFAMKLGAAFQKVNFLRDFKYDYYELGRIYFPNIDIKNFNNNTKKEIEMDIEKDFKDALIGIKQLPANSKAGVYLAYFYYFSLLKKIKKKSANKILVQRVHIQNFKKVILMIISYINLKINKI